MLLRGRQAGILWLTVPPLGSDKLECASVPTSLVGVGEGIKNPYLFLLKVYYSKLKEELSDEISEMRGRGLDL